MKINKYELYEKSVQSPKDHIAWYGNIYKELRDQYAKDLREDFCGTFQLSCEWVKRNRNNTAVGLDLDPEPIAYGKRKNLSKLSVEQKKRIQLIEANVLVPTNPKSDMIVAGNFSFFIFKKRAELLTYFKSCLKSLKPKGVLILEMAGGPGMISTIRETKTVTLKSGKKCIYTWDQKNFDPISHDAEYAIHFKLPDGTRMKNAFTYDWRLWTIPETRDALADAGFPITHVYWETVHRGRGTGEYIRSEYADNAYSWIAHIVALR